MTRDEDVNFKLIKDKAALFFRQKDVSEIEFEYRRSTFLIGQPCCHMANSVATKNGFLGLFGTDHSRLEEG